ncbi:MAG: hypothetical protein ACOYJ6_17205 [Caulobacterales bacterium]
MTAARLSPAALLLPATIALELGGGLLVAIGRWARHQRPLPSRGSRWRPITISTTSGTCKTRSREPKARCS